MLHPILLFDHVANGDKIMNARLVAIFTLWAATSKSAFAVFSIPASVPEPSTAALLVAGGLVVVGARYLSKRKRDK